MEYHGFVYLQGGDCEGLSKDIKGQTAQELAQIDDLLERHGTDKTRLLQAQIGAVTATREAMNELWTAWLPTDGAPARACVQADLDLRLLVEIMVTAYK